MASPEQIETFVYVFSTTKSLGAAIDAVSTKKPTDIACSLLFREVCKSLGVTPAQILRGGRWPHLADARHVAMRVLREHLGASYELIAEELGGMHHTSVMHGLRRVERTPRLLAKAREVLASIEVRRAA